VAQWKSEEKEVHKPNPASFIPTHLIWAPDGAYKKQDAPVLDLNQSSSESCTVSDSQDGPPATKFRRISVLDRLNYKIRDSPREPKRKPASGCLKTVEKSIHGRTTKRVKKAGNCHRAWEA